MITHKEREILEGIVADIDDAIQEREEKGVWPELTWTDGMEEAIRIIQRRIRLLKEIQEVTG